MKKYPTHITLVSGVYFLTITFLIDFYGLYTSNINFAMIREQDYYIFYVDEHRYIFHGPSCLIFDISSNLYDDFVSSSNSKAAGEARINLEESIRRSQQLTEYSDSSKFLPSCLVLNISGKCNLRCTYCFSQDNEGFKFLSMNYRECLDAVDFMINSNPTSEQYTISFFGGEPLLEFEIIKEIIPEILRKYSTRNFYFSITTNGTIMNEEIASFIKQYKIGLLLSFDGPKSIVDHFRPHKDRNTSTFEKILLTSQMLLERKVPFSYRATVVAEQINICELVDFFESVKIPYYLVPCFDSGNNNVNKCSEWSDADTLKMFSQQYNSVLNRFYSKIANNEQIYCYSFLGSLKTIASRYNSHFSCGTGVNMFSVTHGGYIFPCMNFATQRECTIGNIYSGIDEQKRHSLSTKDVDNYLECLDCLIRNQCCGGCLYNRYDKCYKKVGKADNNLCRLNILLTKQNVIAFQHIKNTFPEFLNTFPAVLNIE